MNQLTRALCGVLILACGYLGFSLYRTEEKLAGALVEAGTLHAVLVSKEAALAALQHTMKASQSILAQREVLREQLATAAVASAVVIQGVKDASVDTPLPLSVSDSLYSLYCKAASGACATRGDAGTAVRAVSTKTASSATREGGADHDSQTVGAMDTRTPAMGR